VPPVALVTGGASGLGAECCRQLAAAGAAVAVNYATSEEATRELVAEIESGGGTAVAIRANVGNEEECYRLVAEVEERLGPLDRLVNNAGVTKYGPWAEIDAVSSADWDRLLAVNLLGAWHCIRAAAAGMRARGHGSVVNVTSDSVFTMDSTSLPYVVTKTALVGLTRTLAIALAPAIRVNAVAPGWMATPWLERNIPEEARARITEDPEQMVPIADVAAEVVRLLEADGETGRVMLMLPGGPPRDVPALPGAAPRAE
jgi:3-oxoacyl-[acyl-carrier protein] reductase